ncbi:hypothetical protein AVEN_144455-1 [Araneus ventricosus]|uniref:Uncharacterized protein n=1 Tax=Araneus ventricosus TaxID=182803 RepID=A0A4Y2E202_ARAVE|nr:hypothetical protein AVEN_144455-1 [Araneus ventricosus]
MVLFKLYSRSEIWGVRFGPGVQIRNLNPPARHVYEPGRVKSDFEVKRLSAGLMWSFGKDAGSDVLLFSHGLEIKMYLLVLARRGFLI